MGSGLLTGAMTRKRITALPDNDGKHDARFREPQLSRSLALVSRLEAVADRRGVAAGAVAVAWTLRNPAVDGAIVGIRHPEQVEPIIVAANLAAPEAWSDQLPLNLDGKERVDGSSPSECDHRERLRPAPIHRILHRPVAAPVLSFEMQAEGRTREKCRGKVQLNDATFTPETLDLRGISSLTTSG
jgi:hypothetical protein